jgi:hypothetical protein
MNNKFMAQRVKVPQVHSQIYERKGRKKSYGGKIHAALLSAHIDAGAEFTDIVEIEIQEQLDLDGRRKNGLRSGFPQNLRLLNHSGQLAISAPEKKTPDPVNPP